MNTSRGKLRDLSAIIEEENLGYSTLKEIHEHPKIKDGVINMFQQIAETLNDKKVKVRGKIPHAREDVVDTILNYPKVILEPRLKFADGVVSEALDTIEELRLPFAKMVIFMAIEQKPKDGIGVPKISASYPIYVVQKHDHVILYSPTNKYSQADIFAYKISLNFKNNLRQGKNPLAIETLFTEEQEKVMTDSFLKEFTSLALSTVTRTIFMMTLTGGDFYMSVPSKDEGVANAKRIRKGKKPMIEFRMVTIDGKKRELPSMPHGTHASPRQHWRRGHWRTMKKSGKKVWVDPMLVGDEANGKIIKDYAIGKYDERRVA